MGNCGVGFAPAKPDRHEWLISLMEGVEDIPGTALAEGMSWDWETFPEYMDALEKLPRTVDVACHVRSEEHTSELQSLMRISYAVFCLKKKIHNKNTHASQH